jgi:hypothetical protein
MATPLGVRQQGDYLRTNERLCFNDYLILGEALDRGRDGKCNPSLRTGHADLPHPALQLVVYQRQD